MCGEKIALGRIKIANAGDMRSLKILGFAIATLFFAGKSVKNPMHGGLLVHEACQHSF
jgi:hypothetical protein